MCHFHPYSPPFLGFPSSSTNNGVLTYGHPQDCCVPPWPIQLTPCREFGFPKSSERVHLNQEFSWENFQKVFKTLQVFHWAGAKEELAHSQPLVSAGHWKIRISGHLQGLLLREGKGNVAGSPLGATVQGMKGWGDVPRIASPQPSLHQSPAEFPVLSSAGGSRLSWCPPPKSWSLSPLRPKLLLAPTGNFLRLSTTNKLCG